MTSFENTPTLIFDFDNTLINRQKAAVELFQEIIDEDFPRTDENESFRQTLLYDWLGWDHEGHEPKKTSFTNYIISAGIQNRDWKYYDRIWNERLWQHTVLFEDSKSVLDYLYPKYRLALLTNGSVYSQAHKLEQTGLESYFGTVVISGTYGINKPDKRIYEIICAKLQAKPQDCVYIGDGLVNDVQGSLQAGMRSVWIYPDPKCDTNLPCQRIFTINDLKQLF